MEWINKNIPGLLLSFCLALAAAWLGNKFPIIGGPVFGIVIGIIINNTLGKPKWSAGGVKFTSKKILQWAIIVLGGSLSLAQVWKTGMQSFSVMLVTLSCSFIAAYGFGKLMGIPFKLTSLIGVGTAICGGSAIAAVSPIIEAEDKDVAYSISTIFFFNIIAVLIFPPLGHLLGFSDTAFGLWAGTAVNDTSSVVAAGYAFSSLAGSYATIVKLTRTTMIIPISLIYAVYMVISKRRAEKACIAGGLAGVQTEEGVKAGKGTDARLNYSFKRIFPWFILGFIITSLLNTMGVFNADVAKQLSSAGKFLIIMALTAVGLSADFRAMLKTGLKPLFLGLIVWAAVSFASIGVQLLTGQI